MYIARNAIILVLLYMWAHTLPLNTELFVLKLI